MVYCYWYLLIGLIKKYIWVVVSVGEDIERFSYLYIVRDRKMVWILGEMFININMIF